MSAHTVLITVAVPLPVRAALAAAAHQRSVELGRTIHVSDLMREALTLHTGVSVPKPNGRRGRPPDAVQPVARAAA